MSFYDNNELIAFPLVGDDDNQIPSDLLVDCIVHAPSTLGSTLALRSISVTSMLVSCVLTIDGVDVAYLTKAIDDVAYHQPIALTAIAAGVSGFIAFGAGVNRQHLRIDGSYTFLPACLISYQFDATNPTVSVGGNGFFGLVELEPGLGLSIAAQELRILKEDTSITAVTAAVISITDPTLLEDPIPQCLRPAEGNPRIGAITSINGVQPSCNGDITLQVVNVREIPTDAGVDTDLTQPQGIVLLDEGQPCE